MADDLQAELERARQLLADSEAEVDVRIGERNHQVELKRKLHDMYVALHTEVTDLKARLVDAEEWANSSEHPNFEAGWHAGYDRGSGEKDQLTARLAEAEGAVVALTTEKHTLQQEVRESDDHDLPLKFEVLFNKLRDLILKAAVDT